VPSETLGSTEQGGVLQQAGDDVQVQDKADMIPYVGIGEERGTAALDRKISYEQDTWTDKALFRRHVEGRKAPGTVSRRWQSARR